MLCFFRKISTQIVTSLELDFSSRLTLLFQIFRDQTQGRFSFLLTFPSTLVRRKLAPRGDGKTKQNITLFFSFALQINKPYSSLLTYTIQQRYE